MSNPSPPQDVETGEIITNVKIDVSGMSASHKDQRPPLYETGTSEECFAVLENQILVVSPHQDKPSEVYTGLRHPNMRTAANGTGHEVNMAYPDLPKEAKVKIANAGLRFGAIAKNQKSFSDTKTGDSLLSSSIQRNVRLPCLDKVAPGDMARVTVDDKGVFGRPNGRISYVTERADRDSFSNLILAAIYARNINPDRPLGNDVFNTVALRLEEFQTLQAIMGIYHAMKKGWLVVSPAAPAALLTPLAAGAVVHDEDSIISFIQRLSIISGLVDESNGSFSTTQAAGINAARESGKMFKNAVSASGALRHDDIEMFFGTVNGANGIAIDPAYKQTRRNPAGRIVNVQQNALKTFFGAVYDARLLHDQSLVGAYLEPAEAGTYPLVGVAPH